MPIEEETYKPIRDIFCDYLKIQKKEPLDETLYRKYIDLGITQDDILNEELEKKPTLTDKFVNLFKSKDKLPTDEEKEEKKRNEILQNLDKKILNLSESNGLSITPISQITKDTPLLDKNFDLIPNIRKIGNNKENDDLDIYKSYLDILLNIDENILEPFGFYIANNLFQENTYKKNKDYYKYIIICAVNSRFIALYNKQILLKQLEELLRDITKTLYKCYNRTTASAVDIKTGTVNIKNKVTTSLEDTYKGFKDRFKARDVGTGVEEVDIKENVSQDIPIDKGGSNNQVGGLLYLNTDPEMKKTEGAIIMLNNLFQSKDLTVQSLTQEYNATSSSKVSWLIDILFASGIVLSGGLLGVFASSASTLALTIGNSTLCGITGGVWTFSREEILKSYHFSTDLDDTLKILKKEFDLHYNTSDTNKKLNDCPGVKESILKPVYKNIDEKIKQFSNRVMFSYQKYLDIFEFIVKSRQNILGNKYCLPPTETILTEKDDEFKEIWLPILQDILDKWPQKTGPKINKTYTETRKTDFEKFFKAIDINPLICVIPTAKNVLVDAIDDIKRNSGTSLISSLKTRFLCNDTPQQVLQNSSTSITKTSSGGNGKTKCLKKRKIQKYSIKGKTYKNR